MVNDRLHIICGNCGQDLKEAGMASWEYVPDIVDEEDGELLEPADVLIRCENCATIHFLSKYMEDYNKIQVKE